MKRFVIRLSLIIVLILIGIFLFTIGKEHKIYLDNREITIEDITYSPTATYLVLVDGQQIGEIRSGRRKVAYVSGPGHQIVIQKVEKRQPVGDKIEKELKLKLDEMATINIPALLENADGWFKTEKYEN